MDGTVTGVEVAHARIIKRYANRKLYDTSDSRYVTLQHIAVFVRSGEDVQIIDNKTKEDVTNVTLAQIIYEEEKSSEGDVQSVRSLRGYIQDGRNRLLTSLFDGPMGKLVARPDAAARAEAASTEAASAGSEQPERPKSSETPHHAAEATRDAFKSLVAAPKEALDELQRMADDGVRALLGGAIGHVQQLQSEVRRLQGRIEELESRLTHLAKRPMRSEPPREGDGVAGTVDGGPGAPPEG